MPKAEIDNPVTALITKRHLDPSKPEDAQIIAEAMRKLGDCEDTMTQLLERLGITNSDRQSHQQTYDSLHQIHE